MSGLFAHLTGILVAVQFLTKLPVPRLGAPTARDLGRSMAYYPIVGFAIGALLCLLDRALSMALSPLLTSVLIVTAWAAITGALHLEGFADTADGIAAGGDRARTLAVMKDPNTGAKGAAALTFLILIKIAVLSELTPDARSWALLIAPVLSRWAMTATAVICPYARPEGGLGKGFVEEAGVVELVIACASAIAIGGALLGWRFALPASAAIASTALYAIFMKKKIGGITGDTLGALNELVETIALASFLALPVLAHTLPAFPV
ncbi:MAG TPA: adenosylcobinamide-GDP ribazoletransferase [Spirochaetota bacterium]|nr:adenosylcobinamide-GDP ribazoletransferase [Spirochaetota bacterium]HNT11501.1 adenosylcobinamide-GDP ribazoletransferase [Spirochaetota bacterium]